MRQLLSCLFVPLSIPPSPLPSFLSLFHQSFVKYLPVPGETLPGAGDVVMGTCFLYVREAQPPRPRGSSVHTSLWEKPR